MFKTVASATAGALCLAASVTAHAALPTVTLSFNEQAAFVGPTDDIDIWVTLTVDAGSTPLVFDASTPAPFGFAAADLPTQGTHNDSATYGDAPVDFASYSYVQTNTFFGCSGNFVNGCDPGAYEFNFHLSSEPGRPSFNFLSALSLQPGQSYSYLFGTFTPTAPVADGTYSFYRTGATLLFQGLYADGHDIYSYYTLGETCASETAACAFTRTVTSVPEPRTYLLMALGLLGIGFIARRRRAD